MCASFMTEAHKHSINKHRVQILQNLKVTSELLQILSEDYTLTGELREEIECRRTSQEKIATLLDTLVRRPDKSYDCFVNALVQTHQDQLATLLDPKAAGNYIAARTPHQSATVSDSNNSASGVPANWQPHPQFPCYVPMFTPDGSMIYHPYQTQQQFMAQQPGSRMPFFPYPTIQDHNLRVVTPVQEIDKMSENMKKTMFEKFKAVVEKGEARMVFDVQHVNQADAVRVINSEIIYNMTKRMRGRVVIISNQYFISKRHEFREGAEFDYMNISALFQKLGFDPVVHLHKTKKELMELLDEERKSELHKHCDAFALFLLTHGNGGCVFAYDGEKVPIDDITNLFDGVQCPYLRGKPKMFFIQACQGNKKSSAYKTDGPTNIQASQEDAELSLDMATKLAEMRLEDKPGYAPELPPVTNEHHEKADMVISYATVKGYEAWRHSELGSWFIRSLVYVFSNRAHSMHLLDMLTEVNYLMSQLETEGTDFPYRQVAEKRDTFNRKLYFLPGYISE